MGSFSGGGFRGVLQDHALERHKAHGEKVSNPDDVPAALKRCVDAIRGGRTAILHVRVTKL
jgi:acetolactate synthase-1/2/3 large subunit